MLLSPSAVVLQKPQPAKKEKKKKEAKKEENDGSRDLAMPAPEKKAPHPLAVMDKEAKSPFAGDTWKKVRSLVLVCYRLIFTPWIGWLFGTCRLQPQGTDSWQVRLERPLKKSVLLLYCVVELTRFCGPPAFRFTPTTRTRTA